eukprot:jgi/Tetstr1/463538/TSEL_008417.t1
MAQQLQLSADEWVVVAAQLAPVEKQTWRGVLRGVCRAARDGVDGTAASGATPFACAGRRELLAWAEEQGGLLLDGVRVQVAMLVGGDLEALRYGVDSRHWEPTSANCRHAALGGRLEVLQLARTQGCP